MEYIDFWTDRLTNLKFDAGAMQKGGPRNRGSRGGPVSFEEQFQSNESNSGVGAATSSPGAGDGALALVPPFIREFFGHTPPDDPYLPVHFNEMPKTRGRTRYSSQLVRIPIWLKNNALQGFRTQLCAAAPLPSP